MNDIASADFFRVAPAKAGVGPADAPDGHPVVAHGRIGVLLVNLGTPDATSYWPMRRYLKQFLSDPRVIETNRALWWVILNGVILTKRPFSSGKAYASIWNHERNESPLRTITRAQAEKITLAFADRPGVVVDWAMRYGEPAIRARLDTLREKGADRILVFPLYPQYSASTTATVCDEAFDGLKRMRWQPAVRTVPPYHDDPVYIDALARSVHEELAKLDFEPEIMLASFHGLPKSYLEKGDPYHCHCAKTARLLRDALGWSEERFRLTFQSRFGAAKWLQPYTDKTVEALAKAGTKRIAIVMPGFVADCVETLEEIAVLNAEIFHENGGEKFAALPCLNDSEIGIDVLRHVIERELQGWL